LTWTVELKPSAIKELRKLDVGHRARILDFIELKAAENPRGFGKPLTDTDFWRYRVGEYRVVCNLDDEARKILVLRIGHRRQVYRGL
jgi:mRNA interferase RelE/StbE